MSPDKLRALADELTKAQGLAVVSDFVVQQAMRAAIREAAAYLREQAEREIDVHPAVQASGNLPSLTDVQSQACIDAWNDHGGKGQGINPMFYAGYRRALVAGADALGNVRKDILALYAYPPDPRFAVVALSHVLDALDKWGCASRERASGAAREPDAATRSA